MMFSSASMISPGSTLLLRKLNRRSNAFVGGRKAKTYDFGRPGLALAVSIAGRLPRDGALTCQLLDQRDHFLRVGLSNYLQKRRFSGNVGQPTKIPHLFGHRRQRERLGDRGSRLPQLARQVFVGMTAVLGQLLEGFRLFERRQVLALQVLDERQLHDLGVVDLADDDRHLAQPHLDGGVIAAFAGDDLIAVARCRTTRGSMMPFLGDRGHEL